MFFYYKELQRPTGIENAVYCNFFSRYERHLIVAGVNFITAYRLLPDFSDQSLSGSHKQSDSDSGKTKFEYIARHTFNGNITSIASARLSGHNRDILLITFKDAKLSIVEYDKATENIKVVSLHRFEEDDLKKGWTQFPILPFVRVDPEQRCAAMMFFGRMLAILPFRKDSKFNFGDFKEENEGLSNYASKSPVQNSYVISLSDMSEKIDNVIDVQFLYGYFEPTILVLYEPQKTWPGRVAVRHDTYCMVGISLNIQEKVHPIIWSLSNLPFDCFRILPIPKPIGGAIILAVNSIIYANQSVPPYAVSVNSAAERSSNFPLKPYEGLKISLDCCATASLSPERILISLKTGDLYILTLLSDPMRSVRGINLERSASSVLTTCVTVCEENHIFLGSRLGNSLLLRYKETASAKRNPVTQPLNKKQRTGSDGGWMEVDQSPIDIALYGSEVAATQAIVHYQFEVCDSLLNIGPCGNVAVGQPFLRSQEFECSIDPDMEIVTTSGYGKNGALCVLQRTVRPQIITTFEVTEVRAIWTVYGAGPLEPGRHPLHSHLFISRAENTMVLETGEEINDVREDSGFDLGSSTIYACNLGGRQYVAQVTSKGVRLLEGSELVYILSLESLGSTVKMASAADPYLVLWMSDDTLVVAVLGGQPGPKLDMSIKKNPVKSPISSIYCYRDNAGIFTKKVVEEEDSVQPANPFSSQASSSFDNEEAYLYGGAVPQTTDKDPMKEKKKSFRDRWTDLIKDMPSTHWLFVVKENGVLRIYSLPNFQLAFQANNFSVGPRLLQDVYSEIDEFPVPISSDAPVTHELLVAPLGYKQRRPMLLARVGDEELLAYEVVQTSFGLSSEQLKIKFRKVEHGLILRDRKSAARRKPDQDIQFGKDDFAIQQYHYFANVNGYSGVFLSGNYPHWMFMTSRGELRFHAMPVDGSIIAFAPLNNVNCVSGFLYFNKKEEMRIAILPPHLVYDADWPVRKVPLRVTPHMIGYHLETKTYIVSTSETQTTNKIYRFNGDDKELCTEERDDRFPFPSVETFAVQLFSPMTWEAIPGASMTMDDWETITCLKIVSLAYEGHASGRKDYIAISTNYSYGEDIVSRGRVMIMDIIEVVPEPGQPLTKNKLKTIYSKEQKGPVTCIGHVNGNLITAIGQKLYVWQLKDNDLVGTAFIDSDVYIHQLTTVKNFLLVGDAFKGITLIMYQEKYRTLCVVSRGPRTIETFAADFVVDGSELGFLVTDAEKNLAVYMYLPEARESNGGQKLVRKGDFHIGQHVTSMFRVRSRIMDVTGDKRNVSLAEKKHVTYLATLDGSIGYVLPLAEKTFRRLQMLQNILTVTIPPHGGLNHRAFRTYKPRHKSVSGPARGVLDGDLITKFLYLSHQERFEVSKRLGTKPDELVEDLIEADRLAVVF